MKILIVLAHPELQSFNAAMHHAAIEALEADGHEVKTSDLYRMDFNPVSDRYNFTSVNDTSFLKLQLEEMHATKVNGFVEELNEEQEKMEWCDLMIWQFPLWWFALPAILKGWVDRVFAMGRFYGNGHFYEKGVFKGKKALLSVTTGGGPEDYIKDGFNGDIHAMLRPIHRGILEFVGFEVLKPQVTYSVAHISEDKRKEELKNWQQRLQKICKEENYLVGHY